SDFSESISAANEDATVGALYCKQMQTPKILTLYLSNQILMDAISLRGAIAHEIVHYTIDQNHLVLPRFLEEGLAIYLQTLIQPRAERNMVHSHLKDDPQIPLNPADDEFSQWNSVQKLSFYGGSYLFVRYLVQNFGENMVSDLLSNSGGWRERLEISALKALGEFRNFKQIFQDFTIARVINSLDYFANEKDLYRYYLLEGDFTEHAQSLNYQSRLTYRVLNKQAFSKLRPSDSVIIVEVTTLGEISVYKSNNYPSRHTVTAAIKGAVKSHSARLENQFIIAIYN
ncbi:MAG: hypothetical protein ABL927_02680, partial [Bdellovibrionales bacterium]